MTGEFDVEKIVENIGIDKKCLCGHPMFSHGDRNCLYEEECSKNGFKGIWRCGCTQFVQDNLKLVEDIVERKRKIIEYAEKLKKENKNVTST